MNIYTQYKLDLKKARLKQELEAAKLAFRAALQDLKGIEKIVITNKCTFVYHTGWIEFKQNSLQKLIAKIF